MKESSPEKENKSEYAPVAQEEGLAAQLASYFSITMIRRNFRIIFMFIVIISVTVSLVVISKSMRRHEELRLSTAKPLKFALTNCKLFISEDVSLSVDEIYLSVDIPGTHFSHNNGDVNVIEAHSSIDYTDACVVDMQINPGAVLSGLEVSCAKTCYVSQMGPNLLDLAEKDLTVSGDTVEFMAVRLKAGQVRILAAKGNLHIYSLTLTSNDGQNNITTTEGDVVVQSLNSMKVTWFQEEAYVCMYAPKMLEIGIPKESCYVSLNGAETPSNCSSGYLLCKGSDECTASTSAPVLYLSSILGNVYANVINNEGEPVSTAGHSVRGWPYNQGLRFDTNINHTLAEFIEGLNDSAKADPLVWISLGPTRTFSTAGMYFLFAANQAYLNAYPWWISFFSATLLLSDVYKLKGNLVPGFCPFKTFPVTDDLYSVRSLLMSQFTQFSSRADAAYAYSSNFATITGDLQSNLGFRGMEGTLQLYEILFTDSNYSLKKFGLSRSLSLLLAVIISCILSFIMGCLMFLILVYVLDKIVAHFLGQHIHLREYTRRVMKEEQANPINADNDQVADASSQNENQKEEEKASLRASSQYMLVEGIVAELKRLLTSSVDEFCDMLFVSLGPDDIDDFQPIQLKSLREEYERFCFLKQMPEEDLTSDTNKKKFQDRGYTFEKPVNGIKDTEVEMIGKVRWLRDNEQHIIPWDIDENDPNVSLQKFFKSNCAVTPFETDRIKFEDFKLRYAEFCEHERLPLSVVTRANLCNLFGVEPITETPDYLVRTEDPTKYRVDLERVKQANDELTEINTFQSPDKALKYMTKESMDKARSLKAFIYDALAVILHLAILLVVGCMLIILPLFVELEMSKYDISDYRYKLRYEDFLYVPWNVPSKVKRLSTISLVCLVFSGMYLLIGTLKLISYYSSMSFSTKALKNYVKAKCGLVLEFLRIVEWGYVFAVMSLTTMYISLVLVWSVLGALLNPGAYMAYGAAAGTLVSFIVVKISEFRKLNHLGFQALQELLLGEFKNITSGIMKKMLSQTGLSDETISTITSGEGGMLNRVEKLVRNSAVGKAMVAVGIDPKDAIGMLSGDEEALISIGTKQGVPKDVMTLLLAMIKGENRNVVKCLQSFANAPQLQMDPEIVQLAIDIITNSSDLNIPVIITNLSKVFFNMSHKQLMRGSDNESSLDTTAYLDICKQVFPQLISALLYFKPEEMDKFLEQYERINEYLYDSVKTKSIALTTSKVKVFEKCFNEKGEPNFVFPSYVIKAGELFKLMSARKETKPKTSNLRRIKNAAFYVMEKLFGTDQKVKNMLSLLLAPQIELIVDTNGKGGLISLEEQDKTLTEMGVILEVPLVLLKYAWKVWTGNYYIDDKFVEETCTFLIETAQFDCPISKPEEFKAIVKPVLQFFSVASTRISYESLMAVCGKYSIEPSTAYISYLFGESRVNYKFYTTFVSNPFFQAIAEELQIPASHALGLIALFRNDFSCPQLVELIEALKKRWGLTMFPSRSIISVLALFLGNEENEIITSAQKLKLLPLEFALTAKHLLHPGSICDRVFEDLGIRIDNPIVAHRMHIPTGNYVLWDKWIRDIKNLLYSELKPIDIAPRSVISSEDNKETDYEKVEEKGYITTNETLKTEERRDSPRNIKTILKRKATISADKGKLRYDAKLLLSLNDITINETVIRDFLAKVPFMKGVTEKDINKVCNILSNLLRALKDIKEEKSEKQLRFALNQIAELMNIRAAPLNAILALLYLKDKENVLNAVDLLLNKVVPKERVEELKNFCTLVLDKTKVLKNVEESVGSIAKQLKVPKFFVKFALSPSSEDNKSKKFAMEEFLVLLDQAGFNATAFDRAGITFAWPYSKSLSINELRFILSGLVVGNSAMVRQLLEHLGLPEEILDLAFAMTAGNRLDGMPAIFEAMYPALKKYGIPKNAFCSLLELYKYLDGLGSRPAMYSATPMNGYEYLKTALGIIPEALICLEAVIKGDKQKLINEVSNLIRVLYDLNYLPSEMRVKPDTINGLITVLTGNGKFLENLAESTRIDQGLIDLCLKLTNIINNGEGKIEKKLLDFQQSPLLTKVWDRLGIPPDVVSSFLTLTFRTYYLEDPSRLMQKLSLTQYVDTTFLQFLLSITNSWASLQSPLNPPLYKGSGKRMATIDDLKKYMVPVCKQLSIDSELALLAVRLRQGDFYIIEDYQNYLNVLLPSQNVRKLAMGVCGVLTLPVRFNREFYEYPDQFNYALTFEGACEMLCELLSVNPIVPRIMALDDKALQLIEERFEMSKKAVAWLVMTLNSLPIFVLETIALKELKKLIYLKKLDLEKMLEELEQNERETQKAEEKRKEEGFQGIITKDTLLKDLNINKTYTTINDLMRTPTIEKVEENYYDNIDFNSETYEDLMDKLEDPESLSHKNEILEVLLFNMEDYCRMNYDYVTSKETRQYTFMESDERVLEIFGTQEEYYKAIAKDFFENPYDPSIWLEEGELDLSKSWIHKEHRFVRKNVWEKIKRTLKAIAMDVDATNGAKHKYDDITLGQLCLFMVLLRLRKRVNSNYNAKKKSDFYSLYVVECEVLGVLLESTAMVKGLFGPNFSRIRFLKIMSLALNMNLSNMADHQMIPSMYSKDIFYNFKRTYKNKEELEEAISYCNNFEENVCDKTVIKDRISGSFSEYVIYLSRPNDLFDAERIVKNVSPYLYQLYTENKPSFEYELLREDPFVEQIGETELGKRRKACVKPVEFLSGKFKDSAKDLVSQQNVAEAVKLMQLIEIGFVIEQEKLDFVLDMALLQWNAFEQVLPILKSMGYKTEKNTVLAYKAVIRAASLQKYIQEWKLGCMHKNEPFVTTVIDDLLPFLGKLQNEDLVENIVLLAHGVITPATIKELAMRYRLDYDLVNALFTSGYPSQLLNNRSELRKLIDPLFKKLRLSKPDQKKLVYAIFDICNWKLEGWQEIASYCCLKKNKNGLIILQCMLYLIDWYKIQDSKSSFTATELENNLIVDMVPYTVKIFSFLIENEQGDQAPFDEGRISSFIEIVDGIVKQDLRQIMSKLRKIKHEFGLYDNGSIDLLESFVLLTNKLPIANVDMRNRLVVKSIEVITDWLSSLMEVTPEDMELGASSSANILKGSYVKAIKRLMMIVMGSIHNNPQIIKKGLSGFIPTIDVLTKLWFFIKESKDELFNNKAPLKSLSSKTLEDLLKAYVTLAKLSEEIFNMEGDTKRAVEETKGKMRTINLSAEHYGSIRNLVGRSWECINAFSKKIAFRMERYVGFLKTMKSTGMLCLNNKQGNSFEMEDDSVDPVQKAISTLSKEFSMWNAYEGLVLLLMGDPYLILDRLRKKGTMSIETLARTYVVFKLIEMNARSFKSMSRNPTELKNYENELSKNFVSPIIGYVMGQLALRNQEEDSDKTESNKQVKMLMSPEHLTQMIMLMHHIMFNATQKHLIISSVSSLYEAIKGSLSKDLQKFLPMIVSAISGFNEDKSKSPTSFESRRIHFLRAFVSMSMPDLSTRLPLIERLLNFGLYLVKLGSEKDKLKEYAPKVAEEFSILVGINSELIRGVFGIMQGDVSSLIKFMAPICKIDDKLMATLQQVLEGSNRLISSATKESSNKKEPQEASEKATWIALANKVKDGEAGIRELFELVDKNGDGSGMISVEEFSQLMEKLNISMTTHSVNEIFARCKSKSNSDSSSNELNIQEFEEAITYVQSKRITEGLHLLGISTNQLIFLFTILMIILILLFVFIFLGISAFSMGGAFSPVINSVLPLGAGLAVGKQSPIDSKDSEWEKRVKEVVGEVLHKVKK